MRYLFFIFILFSSLTSISVKAETESSCVRNADGEIVVTAQSNVVLIYLEMQAMPVKKSLISIEYNSIR